MDTYFHNVSNFKISSACPAIGELACVSVAINPKNQSVAIRQTGGLDNTTLLFSKEEWQAFVQGVKRCEFDVS